MGGGGEGGGGEGGGGEAARPGRLRRPIRFHQGGGLGGGGTGGRLGGGGGATVAEEEAAARAAAARCTSLHRRRAPRHQQAIHRFDQLGQVGVVGRISGVDERLLHAVHGRRCVPVAASSGSSSSPLPNSPPNRGGCGRRVSSNWTETRARFGGERPCLRQRTWERVRATSIRAGERMQASLFVILGVSRDGPRLPACTMGRRGRAT